MVDPVVMSVDVETLRRDLEAKNGMPGLEILRPEEVDAAVRIFYRDGFVVVRAALTADQDFRPCPREEICLSQPCPFFHRTTP